MIHAKFVKNSINTRDHGKNLGHDIENRRLTEKAIVDALDIGLDGQHMERLNCTSMNLDSELT